MSTIAEPVAQIETRKWRKVIHFTNPLINAETLFSTATIIEALNLSLDYVDYKLKAQKVSHNIKVLIRDLYFCKCGDVDLPKAKKQFEAIGAKCKTDHMENHDHSVDYLWIDYEGFQTTLYCGFRGMTRFRYGGQEIDMHRYKEAVLKKEKLPVKFVWETSADNFCKFVGVVQEVLMNMDAPGQTRVFMDILHEFFEIKIACLYHETMHERYLDTLLSHGWQSERALIVPKFEVRFPSSKRWRTNFGSTT